MNRFKKAFLLFFTFVFRRSCHYLFVIWYAGRKRIVPPPTNPLLLKSATALAADIREQKVSSETLVRAYIERIQEVNPYINAVVDDRFTKAIEEAKEVDALIAAGSNSIEILEKEKPLLGVPFTVKILIAVEGLRCTGGSLIHQDVKAHQDAESVMLMKRAGAICIATTNSPEFGCNFETTNKVHGTTKNPYDTRRTPGGSSGGESALIGAAGSVIGIGNDLGGSCRFPAFNCCIFGHKPTAGLVCNDGTFPVPPPKLEPMVTTGPLCRYAEDLTTVMKIIAGNKAGEFKIDKEVNFNDVKLYYMLGNCGSILAPKLDPELEESMLKVNRHFENAYAATPELIDLKEMSISFELWIRTLIDSLDEETFDQLVGGKVHITPSKELAKFLIGRSKFAMGTVFVFNNSLVEFMCDKKLSTKFRERLSDLDKEFQKILDNDDAVLFLPTFPTTATYFNETLLMVYSVGYMGIFNVLGYPVTQCTLGLGSNRMPIGLQVVAGKNRDYLTLSVAKELERAFGGWVPPVE